MKHLGWGGPAGAVLAVACVIVSSLAAGRGPVDGLLSELGAEGVAGHGWYRAGQAAGAVGALFVAAALGRHPSALPLAAAGLLIGLATAVPCTAGCPLPLVDGVPPAQDLVHFFSAGAAFALWPWATWEAARAGPLRRVSSATTTGLIVILALLGPLTVVDRDSAIVGLAQRASR